MASVYSVESDLETLCTAQCALTYLVVDVGDAADAAADVVACGGRRGRR